MTISCLRLRAGCFLILALISVSDAFEEGDRIITTADFKGGRKMYSTGTVTEVLTDGTGKIRIRWDDRKNQTIGTNTQKLIKKIERKTNRARGYHISMKEYVKGVQVGRARAYALEKFVTKLEKKEICTFAQFNKLTKGMRPMWMNKDENILVDFLRKPKYMKLLNYEENMKEVLELTHEEHMDNLRKDAELMEKVKKSSHKEYMDNSNDRASSTESDLSNWTCDKCTFINEPLFPTYHIKCGACDSPRPSESTSEDGIAEEWNRVDGEQRANQEKQNKNEITRLQEEEQSRHQEMQNYKKVPALISDRSLRMIKEEQAAQAELKEFLKNVMM